MKLVVYLPALDEAATIGGLLDAVPRRIPGVDAIETLVVDDGSSDGTTEVALAHGARVIRHPHNLGTGRAFTSGVHAALAAGADLIVGMDADGQFAPADIPALVAPILRGDADVALCTRFGPGSRLTGRMPLVKRLGNRALCRIVSMTARQAFTDVSCGFRAFTRDAALLVEIHSDFEYLHESLLAWRRAGQRVVEVELPVRAERADGRSRVLGSLSYYALRAAPVLVRAIRDHNPLAFFGALAAVAFGLAALAAGVVLAHWWRNGTAPPAAPYDALVVVSVGGLLAGIVLVALALLADQTARLGTEVREVLSAARRAAARDGVSRTSAAETRGRSDLRRIR